MVLACFIMLSIMGYRIWFKLLRRVSKEEAQLIKETEADIKILETEAKKSKKKIKELKNEKNPVSNNVSIDDLRKLSNGIKPR
jgi:F0F1-type ATP synthase membrane subunit b/b'